MQQVLITVAEANCNLTKIILKESSFYIKKHNLGPLMEHC